MITVTEKETLISATIELKDVPRKDYNDILLYIKEKLGGDEEKKKEPDARVTNLDNLYDKISLLYDGYEENPRGYILVLQTANEFIEAHPEFKEIDPRPIGRTLSKIAKERKYPTKRKIVYFENSKKRNQSNAFTIPIRCATIGDRIRMCREMAKLSIKELADAINYPSDVVRKWEDDVYLPCSEAVVKLANVFGEDFASAYSIK